ncbi:hypothetical protein KFU94_07010 [Chloroflexi bacterium TSY]|nr:hypothetical protein [Chloroflexi bacterium TSY]
MLLNEIFSCYVSNTYQGDKQTFKQIQRYFEEVGLGGEERWRQVKADETRVIFAKGKSVAFTFDYQSEILEVRSRIDYTEPDGLITVSVGNSGFPFEARLAKSRYQMLLNKIDAYLTEQAIVR